MVPRGREHSPCPFLAGEEGPRSFEASIFRLRDVDHGLEAGPNHPPVSLTGNPERQAATGWPRPPGDTVTSLMLSLLICKMGPEGDRMSAQN